MNHFIYLSQNKFFADQGAKVFDFLHGANTHLDSPLQKLAQYKRAPDRKLRQGTRRGSELMKKFQKE